MDVSSASVQARNGNTNPEYKRALALKKEEKSNIRGTPVLAVKFEELYSSIVESISKNLSHESELTIEVSGDFTLKAEGGAKWLFFNAGGASSKTDRMKVTLKTKIYPNENS